MHECLRITAFILAWKTANYATCKHFLMLTCVFQAVGINSEEVNKKVPVLSSTVYGQHLPIDLPSRKFVRVGVVQRDFFRVSGVTINPSS